MRVKSKGKKAVVRLAGKNDLSDVESRLGQAFRNAMLTALQTAFLSTAAVTDKTAATQALNDFHRAARRLRLSENTFNQRARPSGGKLTVMTHLRDAGQLAAMRDFSTAKETLLSFDPDRGRSIARLVQKGALANIASKQTRPAAPKI